MKQVAIALVLCAVLNNSHAENTTHTRQEGPGHIDPSSRPSDAKASEGSGREAATARISAEFMGVVERARAAGNQQLPAPTESSAGRPTTSLFPSYDDPIDGLAKAADDTPRKPVVTDDQDTNDAPWPDISKKNGSGQIPTTEAIEAVPRVNVQQTSTPGQSTVGTEKSHIVQRAATAPIVSGPPGVAHTAGARVSNEVQSPGRMPPQPIPPAARPVHTNPPAFGNPTPNASMAMPGLGVMPGNAPELSTNVIRVNTDKTEIVHISGTLPNRISTPFANPRAIMLQGNLTVEAVGQSLYVAVNGDPSPVALYVTGGAANDPVVSLALIPRSMPPQTIVLQLDSVGSSGPHTSSGSDRKEDTKSPVYMERITAILRTLALGKVPPGFSEGMLPKSTVDLGPIVARPLNRYSGPAYDIYRYQIEGKGEGTQELEESAFWTEGVRAVAFFPGAIVSNKRPTHVFVVADKSATEIAGRLR